MSEFQRAASGNHIADPYSFYQELLQGEQLPADHSEVISIHNLPQNGVEADLLRTAGVSAAEIETGRFTRQQLLDSGFVFINYGDEKPLISAEIPLLGAAGQMLDTAHRRLLTGPELSAVKKYQADRPEQFGLGGEELETVRLGMIGFLSEAMKAREAEGAKMAALFREAQGYIFESGTEADKEAIFQLLAKEMQSGSTMNLNFLMQQCVVGEELSSVWGIPTQVMPTRLGSLHGLASPFLDSGYHFSTNYDVTMFPNDPSKTRRLNMMNIHLLSRDLNEMGASSNGSHDQTYVTSAEFIRMTEAEATSEHDPHEEQVARVAARLVAAVASK